jgi:drug/metabolite transporter (DMT)-like permease
MTPPATDTAREFQARRLETWRLSKLWLVLVAVGFAGCYLVSKGDDHSAAGRFLWGLAFFSIAGVAIGRLGFIVRDNYRCPNCDQPQIFAGGVPFDPKVCGLCGAKLK